MLTKRGAFTPGPWRIAVVDSDGRYEQLEVRSEKGPLCSLFYVTPEARDDARLIAAAPELYEALRDVVALVDACVLVRNTTDDDKPDWASRQLPFVLTLKRAVAALDRAAP